MTSILSAFPFIGEQSFATPGAFNSPLSTISANIAAINADVGAISGITISPPSGNTIQMPSDLSISGFLSVGKGVSIGTQAPGIPEPAALTIGVNSGISDYLYFNDTSNLRSDYLLGSHAGGTADGLNIFDVSGNTMIVSFSKQSIRFYAPAVGPAFDIGGAQFNIRAYGALGNGVASDDNAIYAAMQAASLVSGTVFVPPTTAYYKITAVSGVTVLSGCRLLGAGYGSLLQKDTKDNGDVISANGINNFEIANLRVRNSSLSVGDAAFCIRVTNASFNGSVHDNFVENSWLGIGVLDVPPPNGSYNISVTDNSISSMGENGIGINSTGSNNRADRNSIQRFGLAATGANVGAGVEIRGAQLCSVSYNLISDGTVGGISNVDGIRVEFMTEGATAQPSDCVFVGNVIRNVAGHGIRVQFARRNVFANNSIISVGKVGIYLLSNSAQTAMAEENLVVGNYIQAPETGIRLESDLSTYPVRRNNITGNVVSGAAVNGASYFHADSNMETGNYYFNSGAIGVAVTIGQRNTFHGISVINSGNSGMADGISISNGTQLVFANCIAYDSRASALQRYGINLGAGADSCGVIGGSYSTNGTAAYLNSGTNNSILGPIDALNNSVISFNRPLVIGATGGQRGFGAQVTIHASNPGTEALFLWRNAASQTADILTVADHNGNGLASFTNAGNLRVPVGSALSPGAAFQSENSLGWYSSGVSTIAMSYGTLNLATQAVRLSMRTLAASSVTASAANTNLATNEVVFTIGGASGASLCISSGGTTYIFSSALSAKNT